jgi:hypothetical protein
MHTFDMGTFRLLCIVLPTSYNLFQSGLSVSTQGFEGWLWCTYGGPLRNDKSTSTSHYQRCSPLSAIQPHWSTYEATHHMQFGIETRPKSMSFEFYCLLLTPDLPNIRLRRLQSLRRLRAYCPAPGARPVETWNELNYLLDHCAPVAG